MKTAEMGKGHTTIIIPSEVIYEILLRLPPKSLLRFRSLSKHYSSVISHPDFIGHHLDFFRSNKSSLLLLHNGYPICLPMSLLNPDLTITQIFFPDLDDQYFGPNFEVTASCNGLLLAEATGDNSADYQLLLWNPATRHFRFLPLPTPDYDGYCYGLGFNSHIDDYYVMQIPNMNPVPAVSDDDDEMVQAKLFSCRKNIWTTVSSNLPRAFYEACPVSLKLGGRDHLFWLVRPYGRGRTFVLAFDLIKLQHRKVEFLILDHHDYAPLERNLTHFKESLAVICYPSPYCRFARSNNNWIELWGLNNENSSDGSGHDSWTQIYNIRPIPIGIEPIIIWGEGELIYDNKDRRICACDINVDDLDMEENTSVRNISDAPYYYGRLTYVKSLVPVYGDTAQVVDI